MKLKYIYCLLLSVLLLGCSDGREDISSTHDAVEISQIYASIVSENNHLETRAQGDPAPVVYLEDAISRYEFVSDDRMVFTTIKRSNKPLDLFFYSGIEFSRNSSGSWERDKNSGSDKTNSGSVPVRIYWSDATSEHTFIGYSLPNVDGFDWSKETGNDNTYFGSIGTPDATTTINYNPATLETEEITIDSKTTKTIPVSSLMRAEDILLAYDPKVVSERGIARVNFYHALSSVKVKVMLSEFYGSELDGYAIVDNMILKNQPTLYRWEQTSYKAQPKNNTRHSDNNPRDMFLWNYNPAGSGNNAGKSFTFYGITVPQETDGNNSYDFQDLVLTFRVRYPDPLKTDVSTLTPENGPVHWIEKNYQATIDKSSPVYFHPGKCTVINIRLNHQSEEITIGAQYTDWDFVPTPDEGSLKKNSTFLEESPVFDPDEKLRNVTIAKDERANEDDATWLYYQKQNGEFVTDNNGKKVLLDIYGNDGTLSHPYTISTANQLLSLAYEVSNGGEDGNGNSFEGKCIMLDAGIIMQKTIDKDNVSWIGIGTDDKPFQGTFLGSERKISRLKGAPLFNHVGSSALIDMVIIENPLTTRIERQNNQDVEVASPGLTGNAALVGNNEGIICACRVDGTIYSSSQTGNVGSIAGTNSGTVFACHHNGMVKGNGSVCGLVGSNSGRILFSYHAGELEGTTDGSTMYGIAPSGTIVDCFYDNKLAPSVVPISEVTGLSTGEMQKRTFIDDVYTESEADDENRKHQIKDVNGVDPGQAGYILTYGDGYTPVKEGDPNPDKAAWNTRMETWVNALSSDDPMKAHFANHSYLFQPANYPKIQ